MARRDRRRFFARQTRRMDARDLALHNRFFNISGVNKIRGHTNLRQ